MAESEHMTDFMAGLKIGKKKGGSITEWAQVGKVIVGVKDGEPIKTSGVVEIHEIRGHLIAETRNSYYYLLEQGTEEDFYTTLSNYLRDKIDE